MRFFPRCKADSAPPEPTPNCSKTPHHFGVWSRFNKLDALYRSGISISAASNWLRNFLPSYSAPGSFRGLRMAADPLAAFLLVLGKLLSVGADLVLHRQLRGGLCSLDDAGRAPLLAASGA